MKLLLKFFLFVLVVVPGTFVGILYALPFYDWAPYLEKRIKQNSGLDVELNGLSFQLIPQAFIKLDGITVRPTFGQGELFSVRNVNMQLDISRLWLYQIGIKQLDMETPKLNLVSDELGRGNWQPPTRSRSGGANLSLGPINSLGHIRVQNGQVTFTQQVQNQTTEMRDLFLQLDGTQLGDARITAGSSINGNEVKLDGRLDLGSLKSMRGTLTLLYLQNTLRLDGAFLDVLENPAFNGDITFSGAQPVTDLNALLPPAQQLKILQGIPLRLIGATRLHQEGFSFDNVELAVGDSQLVVNSLMERKRENTVFNLDVNNTVNGMNLNGWGLCSVEPAAPNTAKRTGAPWTNTVLDFSFMQHITGQLKFDFKNVTCGKHVYSDVSLNARLDKGSVDVEQLRLLSGQGGALVNGRTQFAPRIAGNMNVRLENLPLISIASEKAGRYARLPLFADANFIFQGRTDLELMRSLQGRVNFNVQKGEFFGVSPESLMVGIQSFTKVFTGQQASSLPVRKLQGTMQIEEGVINMDDHQLQAGDLEVDAAGKIDLPNWKLNYRINPKQKGKLGIPLLVSGDLDRPGIRPALTPQAVGAGVGAVIGGPAGAAIGAAIGNVLDGQDLNPDVNPGNGDGTQPPTGEQPQQPVLPFDPFDDRNLKENLRDFLRVPLNP